MGNKGSRAKASQGIEFPARGQDRRLFGSAAGSPRSGASGQIEPPVEPEKPKYPFRCEDRSAIPDAIVEGPFEEFEIATDVYSTAYLIARNSGDMYSIWPWKNRDMLIVWLYLLFIAGSQLFVILSVTFWYPPAVGTDTMLIVCSNRTAVREAFSQGFISSAKESFCIEEGKSSFQADVEGVLSQFHMLERSTRYYDSVLKEGDLSIYVLRLICCVWVFSQVYLQEFCNVQSLLLYHDFSIWFLPIKGEATNRNSWAICLPLIQYTVVLIVCTVSWLIICAQSEAFDIVMNSLAFTFIMEVGSFFNGPLAKQMAATHIKGLSKDDYPDPILYLYPEYNIANAVYEDGKYTDGGWYIVEDEQKAGMLSDYKIRHNPEKYSKFHAETLGRWLEIALFVVPPLVVIIGAMRCHYFIGGDEGDMRTEL